MNRQISPVFRKSMSGYNKEDVNNYIINMSKKYSEAEIAYKNEIGRLTYELQSGENAYEELRTNYENAKSASLSEINALKEEIAVLNETLNQKTAEIDSLIHNMERAESHAKLSDSFGGITDENEKATLFDCISGKTGEIIVIACKTADDIIAKAKAEAEDILNEANSKKDNMLRSISGSADTMTSDISAYIRSTVNGCIDKIYSSIKSVETEK